MSDQRRGLRADALTLAYSGREVVRGVSVVVPEGSFTVIVGPNACGKSTLLRGLSRLLRPAAGTVHLDGRLLASLPAKEAARRLGLLPQSAVAPDRITVADLVGRGRYAHQSLLRQWSREDEAVVAESMAATGVADLAERAVDELSGGQRQRAWLAMVLAQQTPLLLLDEPTTFLDIAHQIEVLDLCADLREAGRTLVAVLHDLNQACRYANHLVVMKDGRVVDQGRPGDVLDADLVADVFGLRCLVVADPVTGTPLVVPLSRAERRAGDAPLATPGAAGPTRPPD